jgi:hypothetical protein
MRTAHLHSSALVYYQHMQATVADNPEVLRRADSELVIFVRTELHLRIGGQCGGSDAGTTL